MDAHRPQDRHPGRGRECPRARGGWEYAVVPLSGSVRVSARLADGTARTVELAGRSSVFAGPTDVAYVPAGSGWSSPPPRRRRESRVCRAVTRAAPGSSVTSTPRTSRSSCAAPASRRGRCATSASRACSTRTRSSRARWSRRPATGAPTRRTSTTRSGGRGDRARGDLLLRDPGRGAAHGADVPENADPVGYQRVYGTSARSTCSRRYAPVTWCWCRTAGTDRRWRPRAVLPERDGRPRPHPRLADLRRPEAHLGPRHLARPGDRPRLRPREEVR